MSLGEPCSHMLPFLHNLLYCLDLNIWLALTMSDGIWTLPPMEQIASSMGVIFMGKMALGKGLNHYFLAPWFQWDAHISEAVLLKCSGRAVHLPMLHLVWPLNWFEMGSNTSIVSEQWGKNPTLHYGDCSIRASLPDGMIPPLPCLLFQGFSWPALSQLGNMCGGDSIMQVEVLARGFCWLNSLVESCSKSLISLFQL